MHIALICDEKRLDREHAALKRLVVGLIGEGVTVTRVIPESERSHVVEIGEQQLALARRVEVPLRVLPWTRRDRTARLAAALERPRPDVIYALGHAAWKIGLDLGRHIECPVALDVVWPDEIDRLPSSRLRTHVAAYVTPTAHLTARLRTLVDAHLVCHVPMGVGIPAEPHAGATDGKTVGVAVLGGARDLQAYRYVLAALARVVRSNANVRLFVELDGPEEHEIWRAARQLDLLGVMSSLGRISEVRSLLTQCSVMVLPEQFGELRPIMLEAMANGLAVVAAPDPSCEMLVDGDTAILVPPESEAAGWEAALMRLLSSPADAASMGARARAHVSTHHRSSDQIARLIRCFEVIGAGGNYQFEG